MNAAQDTADRDGKTQYIVVFKASYYLTDQKPEYEGDTPFLPGRGNRRARRNDGRRRGHGISC